MLEKTLRTVSITDPHIDRRKSNLRKFVETRDASHLTFKGDAKKAVWYTLRYIPRGLHVTYISEAKSLPQKWSRAFAVGVVKVDNLETQDGRKVLEWKPQEVIETATGKLSVVSEDELDLFDGQTMNEIGKVADDYSFLPRPEKGSFALPHTSPSISELIASLPADDDGAPESSAKPSEAQLSNSGSGGAATIDASANTG
jgi:hypothetical protein